MKEISRTILAIDAATRLYGDATCQDEQELWARQEQRHAAARSMPAARAAAAPLLAMCAECPVLEACRRWAELDRYTGIAGGSAWVDGREKPAHWVRRQATESKSA